jgi:DNA (cytosine-5)-methyltransferase 1
MLKLDWPTRSEDEKVSANVSTFASLFCGCGGLDLGFLQEGFACKAALDVDPIAVETHIKNLGSPAEVHSIGIQSAKLVGSVDVLLAGPPCQGFSLAGKRIANDPRNSLLVLAAQIAEVTRPKVFLVENVAGAQSGSHKKHWNRLQRIMAGCGYKTVEFSMRGTECGVPQLRRRSIFLAWRTDGQWPATLDKRVGFTLRDALSDLEGVDDHEPVMLSDSTRLGMIAKRILPGQKLCNVRGGEKSVHTWDIPEVFGSTTHPERTLLAEILRLRRRHRRREKGDADPVSRAHLRLNGKAVSHRMISSLISKGYLRKVGAYLDLTHTFNGKSRRLDIEKPSFTVDTRFGDPRYFLHPHEERGLTVREAARIQGFPDEFAFSGNAQVDFRLIGNAVPPPMARLLAESIKRHLL